MSPRQFPEFVATYIGPNPAHRALRETLANAKALAYVLGVKDSPVLSILTDHAEKARKLSGDGPFALGLAGRATSRTVQFAVHLTGEEIDLVMEAGGFKSQLLALVYREVYRGLETFLMCRCFMTAPAVDLPRPHTRSGVPARHGS